MTTDQPPTRLYSPDGKYWWDGTAWQPAEQAAADRPQAAPAPQWGAPTQGNATAPQWGASTPRGSAPPSQWGAPAPPGAPPRQGPRTVLMVGLVAVVALLVGIATGWTVGSVRSAAGAGPSAPPPIPEEFPGNSQRYLQGVTVSQVTQEWLDTGPSWTCDSAEPSSSGAAQATRCSVGADLRNWFTLNIDHDDEAQVREMDLSCRARADSEECRSIFSWLAGLALSGEPDRQPEAQDWATANAASDLSTTIGRVYVEVRLEPNTIFVTPAP